jgi:hypothetical protein
MSIYQNQNRRKSRLARLEIVGQLYRRHYSNRAIQKEVMARLNLKTYSHLTVQRDIQYLLAEWRKARIENTELLVQGELAQIDECVRELWDQWDKSKEDYKKQQQRDFGKPDSSIGFGDKKKMHITSSERTTMDVIGLGDVSYISEIRQQLQERRKLLGLYAPEKQQIIGQDGKPIQPDTIKIEVIDSREQVKQKE